MAQQLASRFHAIAYHGVVDRRDQLASDDVTLETLVNHFEWLVANNYRPVSIDDLIKANRGEFRLPDKAILLCWDDGYTSFYTHVFPLLKAYNFPAVLALVGNWMNVPSGGKVQYGTELVSRDKFLTWEQIRILAQSPLVEIASHSFDLHKGVQADPAGDMLPSVIAHSYAPLKNTYESDAQMFERIHGDLVKNSALIQEKVGVSPRVMVWPFGRYNELAIEAAEKAGMPITLTLDPAAATTDGLEAIPRIYPTLNPETGAFKYSFVERNRPPLRRFIKVPISSLLEEGQGDELFFSHFLERVKTMAPGRAYFEPVVLNNGELKALFRNGQFPVIQDRLMRLTWHTDRRSGTEVHLILSSTLFNNLESGDYPSFFSDMGRSAPCSGLLLSDEEFTKKLLNLMDRPPIAPSGLEMWDPIQTRNSRKELANSLESGGVYDVLSGLAAFQQWQPVLDVGVLIPFSLLKSTQANSLHNILNHFDYIMVDMRNENSQQVKTKVLSELEIFNDYWPYLTTLLKYAPDEDDSTLINQLWKLWNQGIVDYGYAYDFFEKNRPDLETIKPLISTRTYPFIPQ